MIDLTERKLKACQVKPIDTVPYSEELQALKEQLAEHKEYCCCQKNEVLLLENAKLKELLKEVKEFIEEENPKDFTIMSERMDELLTKINKVMR